MTAMEQPPSAVSVGMVQQCSHAALPCAIAACCQAPRYLVDLLKDEHASIAAAAEAALDVALCGRDGAILGNAGCLECQACGHAEHGLALQRAFLHVELQRHVRETLHGRPGSMTCLLVLRSVLYHVKRHASLLHN